MYFKKEDIEIVKKHVTKHATDIKVVIGADDEARFNQMIAAIIREKQYFEGEDIDPKHITEIKKNINNTIVNLSNYLIKNADTLKDEMELSNPVDYLTTAVDGLYIRAMEQLGCPNMPIILFDADIKKTLEESALEIHRSFVTFDISRDNTFDQQRGKDATEVSKEFGLIAEGIKNGKKAESVGKMIAEYQALKRRQKNHNGFWRFFHRTENKDRNALIEKMGKFIQNQLPEGMKNINLDDVEPAFVSHKLADARIRGAVEVAGPNRLDNKSIIKLYGCAPSDEYIPDQGKIIDEYSHKISLNKDEKFLNDVMGTDNVNMNQVPKEKVFTDPSLVKDRI